MASGTTIASFDVFDTVMVRAVGSPAAVYLLLGKRLADRSVVECTAEAFARAREAAERRAYRNLGVANTTLDHIYAELSASLGLRDDLPTRIMELECELEAELLRPVPDIMGLIHEARTRGLTVVFLSDMYLPEAFIVEQLARHGLWQAGDRCYVSSSHKKLKSSGELFTHLLEGERAPAELVLHRGNHPEFDVRRAQAVGMQAIAFDEGNLNRYEQLLEAHSSATDGLSSALAGASRLARLSLPVTSERERALRDVAAGVAAPTLVGFLLWVLQKAKQAGLNRLYFVSRDGQILLEVARRLATALRVDCELRYLYGSRQAWNLAGISSEGDIDWSWIWDDTEVLSVEGLLARVSIRPDDVKAALLAGGFAEGSWSCNLDPDRRLVLKALMQQSEMKTLILQRAANTRAVFVKYLRQEGLLDPVDWGLVDLGWGGSLQSSLGSTLAELTDVPVTGFYFGLEDRPRDRRFGIGETYFFDEKRGTGFPQSARSQWILLLEMFCSADHGTVLGLIEEAGFVKPQLKEERNETAMRWGLGIVHKTVYCFAESMLLDSTLIDPRSDVRGAIAKSAAAFWRSPTRAEALAWGDFPWEDGFGAHSYVKSLADQYGWGNVARALYRGTPAAPRRPGWPAGSIASMPAHTRRALRAALFLGGWRNLRARATRACRRWIRTLPG